MHAIVVANGAPEDLPDPECVPEVDLIVAADGGAANARRLGLQPALIIGDLDSIAAGEQAELEGAGTRFITHPVKKDATDLELALRYVVEADARTITVLGALGGRPDQMLANVLLLTLPFLANTDVALLGRDWEAFCVRRTAEFDGRPGDVVSLLPLTSEVTGVTTAGLYWALDDATLNFGSTLGISNEMTASHARVAIRAGVLLVLHET